MCRRYMNIDRDQRQRRDGCCYHGNSLSTMGLMMMITLHASLSFIAFIPFSAHAFPLRSKDFFHTRSSSSASSSAAMITQAQRRILPLKSTSEDLNDVLSTMGLAPASTAVLGRTKSPPPKKEKKKDEGTKEVRIKQRSKNPTTTKTKTKTKITNSINVKSSSKKNRQIDLKLQLDYARNGHTVLRRFINPTKLQHIRKHVMEIAKRKELSAWRQKVLVASNSKSLASSCQTTQQCQQELKKLGITANLPFLQYFNNWKECPSVKELAYELGEAASILMDIPTVRLYQDSLFWKRLGDGPTPWHVDARMAPFDTPHMITFWIPLTSVPREGTALSFCSKSHSDFALPYWNPLKDDSNDHDDDDNNNNEWDRLDHRYPKRLIDYMPLEVGDVTVHSGWTLHCSNGNDNDHENSNGGKKDRVALAISFVDGKAEIRSNALSVGDNEDQWSYQDWIHDIPIRKPFRHDLVPIVWPHTSISNNRKQVRRKKTKTDIS